MVLGQGDHVVALADRGGLFKFLLVAGQPIGEPIVQTTPGLHRKGLDSKGLHSCTYKGSLAGAKGACNQTKPILCTNVNGQPRHMFELEADNSQTPARAATKTVKGSMQGDYWRSAGQYPAPKLGVKSVTADKRSDGKAHTTPGATKLVAQICAAEPFARFHLQTMSGRLSLFACGTSRGDVRICGGGDSRLFGANVSPFP
eukprot:1139133-Pelagomonas_calceolata.AAC.2